MTNNNALSRKVKLNWKHEVQFPSINSNKHTSEVGGHEVTVFLAEATLQTVASTLTYVRVPLPYLSSRFVVVSLNPPETLHQEWGTTERGAPCERASEEWRNLCRCARQTRPGELTALWQPTPVDRGGQNAAFLTWFGYFYSYPQSAVAICFVSSSHEAMRSSQRDKRPSWGEDNTFFPSSTKEFELFQTTRK